MLSTSVGEIERSLLPSPPPYPPDITIAGAIAGDRGQMGTICTLPGGGHAGACSDANSDLIDPPKRGVNSDLTADGSPSLRLVPSAARGMPSQPGRGVRRLCPLFQWFFTPLSVRPLRGPREQDVSET